MSDNKNFCPDCGRSWMYCACENNPLNKSEPSPDDKPKEVKDEKCRCDMPLIYSALSTRCLRCNGVCNQ